MPAQVLTARSREGELLQRSLRGDRKAYGELLSLHQPRALALATGIVGNREDALEMVQDASLKSFKGLPGFVPGKPFFPWFYRILRNTCIQHLRKRRLRRSLPLVPTHPDGESFGEPPDRDAPLPEEIVSRDERSRRVGAALVRMPPRDAEILILKHFDGLSYKEIAEALAVPAGTVMSRLHAARRRLRKMVPELA